MVILRICWCCCKNAKRKPCFGSVGPSFLQHFRKLCEAFFGVVVKKSSYADSANLPMDSITPCSPFGGAASLQAAASAAELLKLEDSMAR